MIKRAVAPGHSFNDGNVSLAEVAPLVAQIKEAAREIGRDPSTLHIVSRGSYVVHDAPQGSGRRPLWGTLAEIREDIQRYAAAGLTELFLEPNFPIRRRQPRQGPRRDGAARPEIGDVLPQLGRALRLNAEFLLPAWTIV